MGLELLGLEGSWLGELEDNSVGGELGVSVRKSLKTGFHDFTVKGVKEDLLGALALNRDASLTAGNEGRRHDVVKDCLVDCLEGTGARALLSSVHDSSGGDDSSVGNNHNWPLELGLEVLNDLLANFAEGSEGAERSTDQDVLGDRAVSLLVFDLLSRVDVDETQVLGNVGVALFVVLESLGEFLLELGDFCVALFH